MTVARMSGDLRRVGGPGVALPPAAAKKRAFDQVPWAVSEMLAGLKKGRLERTWRAVQRLLVIDQKHHHQVAKHGGIQPCALKTKIAGELGRHPKTIERHLREASTRSRPSTASP